MLEYVAAPYSDPDSNVRDMRIKHVHELIARLSNDGRFVTSPLLMLPVAHAHSLPTDFQFWKNYCEALLKQCSHIHVLQLPGWRESPGLQWEIETAHQLCIPCTYHDVLGPLEEAKDDK